MPAGLGVSGLGSWTPERNLRWAGRVAAPRRFEARAGSRGCRESCRVQWVPKGAGRAGGHDAELAAVSGLTRRPRGARCIKPGECGAPTRRPGARAQTQTPGDP